MPIDTFGCACNSSHSTVVGTGLKSTILYLSRWMPYGPAASTGFHASVCLYSSLDDAHAAAARIIKPVELRFSHSRGLRERHLHPLGAAVLVPPIEIGRAVVGRGRVFAIVDIARIVPVGIAADGDGGAGGD